MSTVPLKIVDRGSRSVGSQKEAGVTVPDSISLEHQRAVGFEET